MIVFDLDETLADYEHRRHFVEPYEKRWVDEEIYFGEKFEGLSGYHYFNKDGTLWDGKKDWEAFFEACDKDIPILPTLNVARSLWAYSDFVGPIEIWSSRSESVRDKTEKWLQKHGCLIGKVKMRPIGNFEPDEELKEKWLDEAISQGKSVDFVFSNRTKLVCMWKRRGVFVFNVNQSGR